MVLPAAMAVLEELLLSGWNKNLFLKFFQEPVDFVETKISVTEDMVFDWWIVEAK